MPDFHILPFKMPKEGIIRGARGHKQIKHPVGTNVYGIYYRSMLFHTLFLSEQQASKCLEGLKASLDPTARRHIPLESLLAWNFSSKIPTKIARPQ